MTTAATGSTSAGGCRLPSPTTTARCTKDGWKRIADGAGTPLENQGACQTYVFGLAV